MLTFTLSEVHKQISLLWDFQRYILLWWWTWLDCGDCELSLSLKHLCLKPSWFVIEYKTTFLSSKSAKQYSKRCVICLKYTNQILLVVYPDLTILQCHNDILAIIDPLDVHPNHPTDFRWHLNRIVLFPLQVVALHYVVHSCDYDWAIQSNHDNWLGFDLNLKFGALTVSDVAHFAISAHNKHFVLNIELTFTDDLDWLRWNFDLKFDSLTIWLQEVHLTVFSANYKHLYSLLFI